MYNKQIKATDNSPEIILDASGIISITGKSRMEDASLFYDEIHEWVKIYTNECTALLTVKLDLTYFNSTSAKQLLKLLMTIHESKVQGKVIWFYPQDNEILFERGQELEIMLDIPFEFHSYSGLDPDFKISE